MLGLMVSSCKNEKAIVIRNVNVISMTTGLVKSNQDVIIRGDIIETVVESGSSSGLNADLIIEGKGKYLMPGLADMHAHLYQNEDGSDLPLYLANGVTTVRDCNGRPFVLEFREDVKKGRRVGPRILCTTPTIRGWEKEPWTLVKQRYEQGYDAVKLYSFFDSRDAFHKTMAEAKVIHAYTMGHIPYTVGLDGIIEEGMDDIAHVDEIAWEFAELDRDGHHSANDWLGVIVGSFIEKYDSIPFHEVEEKLDEEAGIIARKLRGKNIAVSTTCHYARMIDAKLNDAENYIRIPHLKYLPARYFMDVGMGREKHQTQFRKLGALGLLQIWPEMLEKLFINLYKEGILMTGGTDAIWHMGLVPGFSLHDELAYFVDLGLTPYEALRLCTVNAGEVARRMKHLETPEFGTIEAGKRADMVLLENNPLEDINHIRRNSGVMAGGKWYSKESCSDMLAFDDAKYQALLELFEACQALQNNNDHLLSAFLERVSFEDIRQAVNKNINITTKTIEIMQSRGQTDRIKEHFKKAVKANWENSAGLYNLVLTVGYEMRLVAVYEDALRAAKRTVTLNESADNYDILAWSYALNDQFDEAIEAIDTAIKIDPENSVWDDSKKELLSLQNTGVN